MDLHAHFERHALRRARGIPTVSVLCGPAGEATRQWKGWILAQGGEPLTVSGDGSMEALARAWITRRVQGRKTDALDGRAAALASGQADGAGMGTGAEVQAIPGPKSPEQGKTERGVQRLAAWLDERRAGGQTISVDQILAELPALFAEASDPWLAGWQAVEGILGPEQDAPLALLQVPPGGQGVSPEWVEEVTRHLARIAEALPHLSLALTIDARGLALFQEVLPASHAKAVLAEGLIELGATRAAAETIVRLRRLLPESDERLEKQLAWLEGKCAPVAVWRAYLVAVERNLAPVPESDEQAARARSAAEALLFARLESMADTASLFELNGLIPIPFGARPRMEVDLVCLSRGVAVEVDGPFHFVDRRAYRRDRHKDFLLQKDGFWVLRFLAEDVVLRLGPISKTIREAVILRRPESERGDRS